MDTVTTRPTADALNAALAAGGTVQVTTYLRSTLYKAKHAGMFLEGRDGLYVRSGRSRLCLSHGDRLLVGIVVRPAPSARAEGKVGS